MAGLPDITIAGTLVADPELRFTSSGDPVANFTVAANDRRYDKDTDQWVDKGATFLRCSIWRQAAENIATSLTKGTRVLVTGVLRQRKWETNEGETRYGFEVDATEVAASLKWAEVNITPTTTSVTDSGTHSDEPPF
ncbi:MAG: single-stranded DNA-binding protein [Pseudonocardiales bacterium]|nr:single-stranded DNA-binding protein [Pseudonocardiales bacterium]